MEKAQTLSKIIDYEWMFYVKFREEKRFNIHSTIEGLENLIQVYVGNIVDLFNLTVCV